MAQFEEIVVTDMSRFGFRERKLAAELLTAYASDNPEWLGDGVQVAMNTRSGYVFLTDEDYNVGMMNNGVLEQFHSCPECGAEGFADDIRWNETKGLCRECSNKAEEQDQ